MTKKRPGISQGPKRNSTELRVERVPGQQAWRLLHPRCALERAEDIEDVESMIEHDETEIAIDELRWLLGGCPDFIAAHRMLGEAALKLGDIPLARGHFGHAFRAGLGALAAAGRPGPLPLAVAENRDFFLCGQQLISCLLKLGKNELAAEAIAQLLSCDPTDPLKLRELK